MHLVSKLMINGDELEEPSASNAWLEGVTGVMKYLAIIRVIEFERKNKQKTKYSLNEKK